MKKSQFRAPAVPTIESLARSLASGETTAEALVSRALARAADPDGEGLRAFVRLDFERALAGARASDRRRQSRRVLSALDGIPVAVKDLFDVAGETTTAGSVVLRDGPAAAGPARVDAAVVARLREAGAVIIGRNNMTEFAYSGLGINPHYGTPRSVWDRECDGGTGRVPGGSSSGAGVCVGDGVVPMALGTDTGGSVRIPAAFNAITGFKPTASRVPTDGALPLSFTMDSVGPLAASVACCAATDALLAGQAGPPVEPRALRGTRFAVPQTLVLDDLDPEVAAAFDRAIAVIRDAGAVVEPMELAAMGELHRAIAGGTFSAREAWEWHRGLLQKAPDRYDPRVRARIERGERMSEQAHAALFAVRADLQRRIGDALAGYAAMLLPTVPCVPPRMAPLLADDDAYVATNLRVLRNTTTINFLDGCALSLPISAADEAPVGLSLAQLGGHDEAILSLGLSIETVLATIRTQA